MLMPNPSANSKKNLVVFKIFWPRSIFFECGQIILTMLNYAHLKGKISLLSTVKKNWTCSKNIEHGQNIFELANGIGIIIVTVVIR